MSDRRTFGEKRICEAPSFESTVFIQCRVEEVFAFSFFTDNKSGLVVADLDDVGFRHIVALPAVASVLYVAIFSIEVA